MEFFTHSLDETNFVAERIAKKIKKILKNKNIVIVALNGDLGAGKTTFSRSFVKHLGSTNLVSSPTFSLVNHYKINNNQNKNSSNNNLNNNLNVDIFHFDMYRIKTEDDLYSIGFYDYLSDFSSNQNNSNQKTNKSILIIEWAENILSFLPLSLVSEIININFSYIDENSRKIDLISNN